MKIKSLTLKGFRCFGETPATIRVSDEITALIGANGSGKTAYLDALQRVFGLSREQRAIQRTDFHIPPNTPVDDRTTRSLFIEMRLIFPELEKDGSASHAIPPSFQHMIVKELEVSP